MFVNPYYFSGPVVTLNDFGKCTYVHDVTIHVLPYFGSVPGWGNIL